MAEPALNARLSMSYLPFRAAARVADHVYKMPGTEYALN